MICYWKLFSDRVTTELSCVVDGTGRVKFKGKVNVKKLGFSLPQLAAKDISDPRSESEHG